VSKAAAITIFLAGLVAVAADGIAQQANWKYVVEKPVLKLKMSPLAADTVKAFFGGRGFSARQTEYLAQNACMFRSDIGSRAQAGGPELAINIDEWRIITANGKKPPRLRDEWSSLWQAAKVGQEQQTAFYWAMFPTRQVFEPSDYNWGMFGMMLAPASHFDLQIVWHENGVKKMDIIRGMECGK
jgi:hypothetical protein